VYDLVWLRRIADIEVDSLTGGIRLIGLNVTAARARQKKQSKDEQQAPASAQSSSSATGSEPTVACTI
jgi:hypothetical protein